MAGTLTISTLSDGTNSTSATNCIQGSAKAWVRFNGTVASPTLYASYNVSSVTKSGTGQYVVNMTNAMSDTNYGVALSTSTNGTTGGLSCCAFVANYQVSAALVTPTTSQFVFCVVNTGASVCDSTYATAIVYR